MRGAGGAAAPGEVARVTPGRGRLLPIVVSVPHCGLEIPAGLRGRFRPEVLAPQDDADFFVDRLYDWAPDLGIALVTARFSRYVVDLNRDPSGRPLYDDGRNVTGLVPATTFAGAPLYRDRPPEEAEIRARRRAYFDPYHRVLARELAAVRRRFGLALLWDAHSIRRSVPALHPDPFPDLILGTKGGGSAARELIEGAAAVLRRGPYQLTLDHPFRGGYITRHYGRPGEGLHALQLEMSKPLYMDEDAVLYDEARAAPLRALLRETLAALGELLLRTAAG